MPGIFECGYFDVRLFFLLLYIKCLDIYFLLMQKILAFFYILLDI